MRVIDRHSTVAHAAWHDLLRLLQDEAVSTVRGTPTRVERKGRVYWYDSYRIGTEVRKTYIGEDSDELRTRLAQRAVHAAASEARRRERARLIRLLRAEGFMGVDAATGSLLAALAKVGVFRLGGTIVGTHAFRLYEGVLGVRYRFDQAAQTNDLDIASFAQLSLALGDTVSPDLADVLSEFTFEPVPSLEAGKAWRWKQSKAETLVEFLTPSFDNAEGLRPLPALGVHAQSLHFLNFALADPIHAPVTYRSGVLVQLPRPERFAIHKLIVADRRREGSDSLKAVKDRAQAAFLIAALAEDRPDDLLEAWETARMTGPRSRERIDASLARMPDTKKLLHELGWKPARAIRTHRPAMATSPMVRKRATRNQANTLLLNILFSGKFQFSQQFGQQFASFEAVRGSPRRVGGCFRSITRIHGMTAGNQRHTPQRERATP